MTRTLSLASAVLVFCLAVGCSGGTDGPRNDMPIKASGGVDKKGKQTKMMEATLEDPPKK